MSDEKYVGDQAITNDEITLTPGQPAAPARRPWAPLIVALLFLALWMWREFGIRVMREHLTSQEAEINRLQRDNDRLTHELERLRAASAPAPTTTAP